MRSACGSACPRCPRLRRTRTCPRYRGSPPGQSELPGRSQHIWHVSGTFATKPAFFLARTVGLTGFELASNQPTTRADVAVTRVLSDPGLDGSGQFEAVLWAPCTTRVPRLFSAFMGRINNATSVRDSTSARASRGRPELTARPQQPASRGPEPNTVNRLQQGKMEEPWQQRTLSQ